MSWPCVHCGKITPGFHHPWCRLVNEFVQEAWAFAEGHMMGIDRKDLKDWGVSDAPDERTTL